VDIVNFRKGHGLGFSNIATSSLSIFANLAPLAMESQQKFFQKLSKQAIGETISMLFGILEPSFLLPSLIMQCKKKAVFAMKKEVIEHQSLFLKGHHHLTFL
jgi:hypothetical protein